MVTLNKMRSFTPLLFTLFVLVAGTISAQTISVDNDTTAEVLRQTGWSITGEECLEHVSILASEEFSGRGPGSEHFRKTAEYIAHQFRQMGLSPGVRDTSYYQRFTIGRNFIQSPVQLSMEIPVQTEVGYDTLWMDFDMEEDFIPAGSTAPWDTLTDVVLAGYGISAEEKGWDDYEKIDVRNKLVMVLNGAPDLEEVSFGGLARTRNKISAADSAGAAGVITVGHPIGSISTKQKLPAIRVTEETAEALLKGTGYTVDSVKKAMKAKESSIALHLKHRLRIQVKSEFHPDQKTMNIVGVLPGSDPELKDEYLVVGAHADHLGRIAGKAFYGANDNGSGTATVLEVAEAFSKLPRAPKRSVVFILFSAEEMGLLGSKYYADNPLFPAENTRAMINLDMVGSGREALMLVGGHTYPEFAGLFEKLSQKHIPIPIRRRWTSNNSDHYPFHEIGIPSIFMYAVGGVPTYHSTRDRAETLDPETMEKAGRITFLALWHLANTGQVEFQMVERPG